MIESPRRRSTVVTSLALLLAAPALSACTTTGQNDSPAIDAIDAIDPAAGTEDSDIPAVDGLPSPHVHGVARNPADDKVYLATHDGLFRYDADGPVLVGPVIDLMGFTVAGPDRFYASGHPGAGTDLPQPVGLIESVDAGATWTVRSRGGESDFHALTAAGDGVLGFDGALRHTTDAQTWSVLEPPVDPYAITASADGSSIVMTSQSGPVRSSDGGQTWDTIDNAPLLQVVDWADRDTVVGVTPTGTVAVSEDAGATWTTRAETGDAPQAVGADTAEDGTLNVLVVTADTVLESTDAASTFAPFVVP